MQDKIERLISKVYKSWKKDLSGKLALHPDEEIFACFLDGKLNPEEQGRLKEHIVKCNHCAEIISLQIRLRVDETKNIPAQLQEWAKKLIGLEDSPLLLALILKIKGRVLEILNTNGDVLVGQELVPALILRSRQMKDFKDRLTILKDFRDVRVEIKIESKVGNRFNVVIIVKDKQNQKVIRDLRATLIKDDIELESYLNDSGSVIFESVSLGKYKVEISSVDSKIASILLDLRV
ncbi:MAG: hypothetical protein KKC42_00965 [Candidatus Omnitrophica bacterium]|nr:hypothetical protein [Candidatus Omnitrophota bacterium]